MSSKFNVVSLINPCKLVVGWLGTGRLSGQGYIGPLPMQVPAPQGGGGGGGGGGGVGKSLEWQRWNFDQSSIA